LIGRCFASCVGLILVAALEPAPCAAAGCTLAKLVEFPITMTGPRALTTVKINGVEQRLTVDSGAFYSMLSAASAAQLNLKTSPLPGGLTVRGMGGGTAQVLSTRVKTLTLANVDLHDMEFLVGGTEIGAGSIGVLGRNILYLADIEYDLANGVIRLIEPKDCGKKPLAYWSSGYSESSFFAREDMHPPSTGSNFAGRPAPWMVTNIGIASVNGSEIHVLLDTGSTVSILSLKAAAKAGVTPDSAGVVDAGDSIGIGRNTFRTYIARFDSFKIGQEEIKNARLRFGDIDVPGVDMMLGADFFLSHRIYVANSQHKIYFTYNGGPVFDLSIKPKGAGQPTAQSASQDEAPKAAPSAEDAADYARRGEAFDSRRDFGQALTALSRACELDPDNAEYLHRRGIIYEELQRSAPALADYDRALQLRPSDLGTLLSRADLKVRTGDKPGAGADLDAADAVAAKQANERFRMARVYASVDRPDEAIVQLGLWIDAHPEDAQLPAALNERCWLRTLQGVDLPLALKDCNTALRRSDRSSLLYARIANSRGLLYLRMGDYDKSIADYDAALKLAPKDAWAWYGRGVGKLRKQRVQDGDADIAQAEALRPGIADEFKRRAIAP
jgi:tetratricopeptide (TPR) repeat protein